MDSRTDYVKFPPISDTEFKNVINSDDYFETV